MSSFHFVRGEWHQLEHCVSASAFRRRKLTHCLLLLGEIKTQQSAFKTACLKVKNRDAKGRQLTRRVLWSVGKKNHSNHTGSEESPRISSLLVKGDARAAPRLHSPFHQAKPVVFLSCVQTIVSYTIWWEKLEVADGKLHPQGTQPRPSHFQGWDWKRAMAEQTKWCMSRQCVPGDTHQKFDSTQN